LLSASRRRMARFTSVHWVLTAFVFAEKQESRKKYYHRDYQRRGKGFHSLLQIYYLTNVLTPWSTVLLEKLTVPQPVKKFPAFYITRMFITAWTNARHLSLYWRTAIQSMTPHPTPLKIHISIILPSTSRCSKWSLFIRFPHKNPVSTSPVPQTCHMPRPSPSWFDRLKSIRRGVQR